MLISDSTDKLLFYDVSTEMLCNEFFSAKYHMDDEVLN